MLALALGGRTIAEWQQVMTEAEFRQWAAFYRDHPFDDFHRFHRPAALIAQSMAGGDMAQKLEWLQPPAIPDDMTSADAVTLKAFGIVKPKDV